MGTAAGDPRGRDVRKQLSRLDFLILGVLTAATFTASFLCARSFDSLVLAWEANDSWFEGDTARVFANMTKRKEGDHYRTKVHPLFSLIGYSIVRVLRTPLGFDVVTAVRIAVAGAGAMVIGLVYVLLRLLGCRRLDAAAFGLLGATSAWAVFWFVVPETYAFGAVTLLLVLIAVALAGSSTPSETGFSLLGAATLSVTVTNWMAGIIAAFVLWPWRRAVQISANAFSIVVVLWGFQKLLFPSAAFFVGEVGEETKYVLQPEAGGPFAVLRSFVFHSEVMPAIQEVDRYAKPGWPVMATQYSWPGSASAWGAVAACAWAGLLAVGLWTFLTRSGNARFRLTLGLLILGQLLLHLLYGAETFLYSGHFGPLLVTLAAFGTLTRARPVVLVLAVVMTVSGAVNNYTQWVHARGFYERHGTERELVLSAMKNRPADPWPRGSGHVILATPGSPRSEKAYHEPGGSFSPCPGSFGVSVWVVDGSERIVTTSDTVRLEDVRQTFAWEGSKGIPAIETRTPLYDATWSSAGPGSWNLRLAPSPSIGYSRMQIVVRSVGPAGGPITSLEWKEGTLLVNGRWSLTLDPPPAAVHLAEEGPPGWTTASSATSRLESGAGWGHARFDLAAAAASSWRLGIEDSAATSPVPEALSGATPAVAVELPDPVFEECLKSQVAHLMMSLVGRQTRSSDPVNVPIPWQRTGAYIIAALAGAGKLEAARELSIYLAENDFYGGFGPEADAPGLGIWALEEVAARVNRRDYDQELWPHVRRKAEWILRMLSAKESLRVRGEFSIVPKQRHQRDLDLVAEPSRDGLIIGRMDFHRPLLYVNAMSYKGLVDAAGIAERLEHLPEANRWRAAAAELEKAWARAFRPPASENDRTYIAGLWPAWVAARVEETFRTGLEGRWGRLRDSTGGYVVPPLWTYFEVADAHQWLFLGREDRSWQTLRWLFGHQASPGLYTWWEGKDEGNAFGDWKWIRGWVNPPNVQPHYWTTAEMILLQLDMLAHVDGAGKEPELVVGAGIPASWMGAPLAARGLSTRLGRVDWSWRDGTMRVAVRGRDLKVRLGPSFPRGARLEVEHPEAP